MGICIFEDINNQPDRKTDRQWTNGKILMVPHRLPSENQEAVSLWGCSVWGKQGGEDQKENSHQDSGKKIRCLNWADTSL